MKHPDAHCVQLKLLNSRNDCDQNVLSKYLKWKVVFSKVISPAGCYGVTV